MVHSSGVIYFSCFANWDEIKKLQAYKPDSVFRRNAGTSAIYLVPASLPASALPTLPAGDCSRCVRAAHIPKPGDRVYLAFQPARFIRPAYCYATPCAFTTRFHPYPENFGAVIFCDTFYAPVPVARKRKPHPLGGAALCVVRTFLPFPVCGRDTGGRAACSFIFDRQK